MIISYKLLLKKCVQKFIRKFIRQHEYINQNQSVGETRVELMIFFIPEIFTGLCCYGKYLDSEQNKKFITTSNCSLSPMVCFFSNININIIFFSFLKFLDLIL